MKSDAIVWEDGGVELFRRTVVCNCLGGQWCRIIWEDGGVELFIWEEVCHDSRTSSVVVGSCSLSRVRRYFGRVIGTFTLFRNKVRRVTVV